MTTRLPVLQCGNCEPLKLGVHAGALGLSLLCGVYNAAAWLARRETHLAVNTILYTALSIWEQQHVAHHLAEMRKPAAPAPAPVVEPSPVAAAESAALAA
jgi:hypothetical protein